MVTITMVVTVITVVMVTNNHAYDGGGADGGRELIRNGKILESVRLYI